MIELLRMAVTLLQDPTIGVNAQVDALTLNGSDARPPHVPSANIIEPSTAHTQLRDELLTAPYIICDVEAPADGQGQPFCGVVDYTMPLKVGYFARLADDRLLRTQAEYSMRAILQAIDTGWFTAANRPVYGRLNGTGIMSCLTRRVEVFSQTMYGSNMAAGAVLELRLRDLRP